MNFFKHMMTFAEDSTQAVNLFRHGNRAPDSQCKEKIARNSCCTSQQIFYKKKTSQHPSITVLLLGLNMKVEQ
jgi:hypothetical protein